MAAGAFEEGTEVVTEAALLTLGVCLEVALAIGLGVAETG